MALALIAKAACCAITAAIVVGSLWPRLDVGAEVGADLVAHMGAYGALTASALLGWRASGWLLIAVICAALGAGLEVAQALVPGRASSWSDAAANVTGVLVATVIVKLQRLVRLPDSNSSSRRGNIGF